MKELLTDKCKEDFEKWFLSECYDSEIEYNHFLDLRLSLRYGVYLEFFDSVGLKLYTMGHIEGDWDYSIFKYGEFECEFEEYYFKTRQEAQKQAIIKANTIYNERH